MKETKQIKTADIDLFNDIQNGVTLIDFNADWCSPCLQQRPILRKVAEFFKDRVQILDINVDQCPEPAMSLSITSIPTLIVFKSGYEFERFIGIQTEETISKSIEDALTET
jgi:thioredoxin 1